MTSVWLKYGLYMLHRLLQFMLHVLYVCFTYAPADASSVISGHMFLVMPPESRLGMNALNRHHFPNPSTCGSAEAPKRQNAETAKRRKAAKPQTLDRPNADVQRFAHLEAYVPSHMAPDRF